MGAVTGGADVQEVAGEFSYLAPESTVLRRFTAPGESVNTGAYRAYEMPVRNGRPVRDQFTLDRNGFAIIGHASSVADFTDTSCSSEQPPNKMAIVSLLMRPGSFRSARS